jgi:small subunit ribosomal protein S4e
MSNHQKRLSAPTSWPVERKTQTYTIKADAGPHGEAGVPLLVVLRDVLGYADSRKEARFALEQDSVLINGHPASDEERPIGMFDLLAFAEREEYYRVFPDEGGRLALTPIDEDAAGSKLGKVVGKRQVPGGDTQLTLHDGQTLLTDDESISGGDSVVVDNKDASIVAHFPYEEGALVTAVRGQHAGDIGTIESIRTTAGSSPNNVIVERDDERFETIEEYVVVIDENFTDGEDATTTELEDESDVQDAGKEEADPKDEADGNETDEEEVTEQ